LEGAIHVGLCIFLELLLDVHPIVSSLEVVERHQVTVELLFLCDYIVITLYLLFARSFADVEETNTFCIRLKLLVVLSSFTFLKCFQNSENAYSVELFDSLDSLVEFI